MRMSVFMYKRKNVSVDIFLIKKLHSNKVSQPFRLYFQTISTMQSFKTLHYLQKYAITLTLLPNYEQLQNWTALWRNYYLSAEFLA